jgi:hypothetical protein
VIVKCGMSATYISGDNSSFSETGTCEDSWMLAIPISNISYTCESNLMYLVGSNLKF